MKKRLFAFSFLVLGSVVFLFSQTVTCPEGDTYKCYSKEVYKTDGTREYTTVWKGSGSSTVGPGGGGQQ